MVDEEIFIYTFILYGTTFIALIERNMFWLQTHNIQGVIEFYNTQYSMIYRRYASGIRYISVPIIHSPLYTFVRVVTWY